MLEPFQSVNCGYVSFAVNKFLNTSSGNLSRFRVLGSTFRIDEAERRTSEPSIVNIKLPGRIVHAQDPNFDAIPDFRLQGSKPAGAAEKSEKRYAGNNH